MWSSGFFKKDRSHNLVTKKNIQTIPELMNELKNVDVMNYSVHRAIPVE